MRVAKRIEKLPPYLFVEISRKMAEKRARGEDVVTFGIGDPDIPTPKHIIEHLCEQARRPENHRYPESEGLPAFHDAIADWYERRFAIKLDPRGEVLPLIGAKEGIGHIAFCFLDPGDTALVPDPGYPVYGIGTQLAGGEAFYLPLKEENGFLPELERIPRNVADKARVLWINYPNNPTSAVAGLDFFERVVHFARSHDILVCHDMCYSEVAYDGYRPHSFLEVPGARDIGVEFHSLSKSYNMTGWRVGMVVGNSQAVKALTVFKSNLDSGIPQAIQYAAIAALRQSQDCIAEHNAIYQRRRDHVVKALNDIGMKVLPPRASLYVWARVPAPYTSTQFATKLLDEISVVVTPGIGYGACGEGYIRLSLTTPDDRVEEGLSRLRRWSKQQD